MTVKELKAKLRGLPDDMKVVLSSDEEGNSFGELFQVSQETTVKSGRILELEAEGEINAVVLWPS
jgi:hypothetical protein